MQKTFLFTAILMVTLSISCTTPRPAVDQKDSTEMTTTSTSWQEQIIGTWKYKEVYEKEKLDAESLKMVTMFFSDTRFQFMADGQFDALMMEKEGKGTWQLSEETKMITLSSAEEGEVMIEIITLSAAELVIKFGRGAFILGRVEE